MERCLLCNEPTSDIKIGCRVNKREFTTRFESIRDVLTAGIEFLIGYYSESCLN